MGSLTTENRARYLRPRRPSQSPIPDEQRWHAKLPMPRRAERAVVMIVADEPLIGILAELARSHGYDIAECTTPLDVVQALIDLGPEIDHAIVSSGPSWSLGLREFLADEYPEINRILLIG